MATIQDVARLAGVSTATVSRVLNDNYRVSDRRRQLVLDAVKQLGYRPNIVGRNLSRSENRTILVVSSFIDDDMLYGAQFAAKELGYDLILSYAPDADDRDALKYFENGLAGGILFINFSGSDQRKLELCRKYPVVQCAEYLDVPESCLVSIRDEDASYQLTEMLIKDGHKRFAFIGNESVPNHTIHYSIARERGFRRALKDNGIALDEEFVYLLKLSIGGYDGATAAAAKWLKLPKSQRPDAVVCVNDMTALGFVNAMLRSGVKVPQEIAVTGFDNRRSNRSFPMITTVAQPFREMGAESIRMLVGMMSGAKDVQRRVFLDHQIIVRGSTDPTKE